MYSPASLFWAPLTSRVDITELDVVGSMVDVSMMILFSLSVRMLLSCIQVIEVSGTLVILTLTDKRMTAPESTLRKAVCPEAIWIVGSTNEIEYNYRMNSSWHHHYYAIFMYPEPYLGILTRKINSESPLIGERL